MKKKYASVDVETYRNLASKPILFVSHLTKKYFGRKTPAINDVSFNVYPGEFHAFIGANGAGKTTTIKSIIGAYYNWHGTILIDGINNNDEKAKKKIGYIPETARFPEKFSSIKYLIWMLRLSGFSNREAKRVACEKLKEFNMWKLRHKSPNSFSSGQKKKILLAQSLMHNPDVIIMDEPVANLDPKARSEFFSFLNDLKKQGKAIFVSSHVLAELDLYFDSVTILDGGKIVFSGTKKELNEAFATNEYKLITNNNKKIISFLHKHKWKFTHSSADDAIIIHKITNEKIAQIQKYITTQKILIIEFARTYLLLEEVYDRLIVKGSVDTMN